MPEIAAPVVEGHVSRGIAHSRAWLDYEQRVASYWPEFAQHGKEKITVRQLLAQQAGLFAFDEPVDRSVVADLDRLAVVLARQKPAWEPGTHQAYHAISLGFYEGELFRRVDPRHRSLGQFFQDEIATPLGEDIYIRLPEEIPNSRLATLAPPGRIEMLVGFRPLRLMVEGMNRRSNIYRALVTNPGFAIAHDQQHVYARNLEVPSGGAVGTARAIAHAYGVFAAEGRELGLRQETLDLLAAPAIPPTRGFHDECLKGEVQFALGFMKPCEKLALRQRPLVRLAGLWRLSQLRGSGGRPWIRLRDQPDAHDLHRRSARCGAQRGALSALGSHAGRPSASESFPSTAYSSARFGMYGRVGRTLNEERCRYSDCADPLDARSTRPAPRAPGGRAARARRVAGRRGRAQHRRVADQDGSHRALPHCRARGWPMGRAAVVYGRAICDWSRRHRSLAAAGNPTTAVDNWSLLVGGDCGAGCDRRGRRPCAWYRCSWPPDAVGPGPGSRVPVT